MNRYSERDLQIPGTTAAALLPPATVGETGWDILLALHTDQRRGLSLEKLGALVSVHRMTLGHWLSWLEDRRLVMAASDEVTDELRAVLTSAGRELLDRYFSAIGAFQSDTRQ